MVLLKADGSNPVSHHGVMAVVMVVFMLAQVNTTNGSKIKLPTIRFSMLTQILS